MDFIVFAIIVVVIIFTAFLVSRGVKKSPQASVSTFPYEKGSSLCSPTERSFLGVLEQLIGDNFRVFAKVSLYDVIQVKKGLARGERQAAFNRISSKHLDFVVCEPSSLAVVCAIELDDSSHKVASRQERDAFLERAMHAADIPLLRFPVKQAYTLSEIREKLITTLSLDAGPISQTSNQAEAFQTAPKTCPNCASELVVKTAKKGANAGKSFLACPNYPECKFTASL